MISKVTYSSRDEFGYSFGNIYLGILLIVFSLWFRWWKCSRLNLGS